MVEINQYREKILNCAKDILKTEGLKAMTVSNISKRCNISKRSFYESFQSKKELISQLKDLSSDKSIEIIDEKEMIVEKAEAIFARYGFNNVDMNTIAKAAGVKRGILYRYFKNKNELLECSVEYQFKNIKNIVNCIYINNKSDSVEFFRQYITGLSEYLSNSNQKSLLTEIWSKIEHDEKLKEYAKDLQSYLTCIFKSSLQTGIEEGIFRSDINSDALTKVILMFINGMALFYTVDRTEDTVGNVSSIVLDMLFSNIKVDK